MCPNLSLNDPAFVGGRVPSEFTGTVVQIKFGRFSLYGFSRKYHSPSQDQECYSYGTSCYDEAITGTQTSGTVGEFDDLDTVDVVDSDPTITIYDLFADATYWGENSGNEPAAWKQTVVV